MATTTFAQTRRKPVRQTKYLIGAFLILGVIAYLIFFGLTSTQQYALDLGQLQAKGTSVVGQGVRVIGNLDQDSIQQDVRNNKIAFVITDGTHRLPVSYTGAVPDTFNRATEVIAEGKLNGDGSFTASLVLAKCPSKYDASKLEWHSTNESGNLNYSQ